MTETARASATPLDTTQRVGVVDRPDVAASELPGTSHAIARVPATPIAHVQRVEFDATRLKLLGDTIMQGATAPEIDFFAMVCRRVSLDPFAKQIHAVKRSVRVKKGNRWENEDRWTFQVAIDGFRIIADRTGKYRGQTTPLFCDIDGVWVEVWMKPSNPVACKVGVYRSDFDAPLYAVALWREYVQEKDEYLDDRKTGNKIPAAMWAKMPAVMLAKVAEALALRKAFPQELSGLYSDDEMAQADNDADHSLPVRRAEKTTQSGTSAAGVTQRDPNAPITGVRKGAKWTGTGAVFAYGPMAGIPLNATYDAGEQRAKGKGADVVDVGGTLVIATKFLDEAIAWALGKIDKSIAARDAGQTDGGDVLSPEQNAKLEAIITAAGDEKKRRAAAGVASASDDAVPSSAE